MRVISVVLLAAFLLTGCGNITDTFTGQIEGVVDQGLLINCSKEVTKGEKNVNDIGYGCTIVITEETEFIDAGGQEVARERFISGSLVEVKLTKAVNFSDFLYGKSIAILEAKEIILRKEADS